MGICFALGAGFGAFLNAGGSAPEAAVPSAEAPKEEPPAPPPKTPLELAAEGDFQAMEAIEKKPEKERTFAELTHLHRGKQVMKMKGIKAFADQLKEKPDLIKEEETLRRMRVYFQDSVTSSEASDILLERFGESAGDLLYEVWVGTPKSNEYTEFAQRLLYSEAMQKQVSPALRVALDLRVAEECETFKEILPRAAEHGDRRSLRLLGKLIPIHGCGETKQDDCYACLRPPKGDKEALAVVDVIRKVRGRRPPQVPDLD
jgi:hypothetical protein